MGTKVLRYWEVLQRGGADECLWATKAPRVTRAGKYGKGNAPLKKCIGLLLILNNMHNTATDRWWAMLHSEKTPAKKPALLTTFSSSLRCESAEHHTAEQYYQDRQNKAPELSQMERPIMKYLPGLSHDTKPLSCCTGNRAKVLLKGHLNIKRHPNMTRSADSFSTVPPRVNGVDWRWTVRDLETIIVLVLLAFSFISSQQRSSSRTASTNTDLPMTDATPN